MASLGDNVRHGEGVLKGRRGTAPARRPTMKDVANLAGVSLATVSRVVNGSSDVRPDLALRVQDAVEVLGYRRDHTASTLRRTDRLSSTIGLIIEDVANPFFSAVHRGVENVARMNGVLTFAGSSDEEPVRERELAEAFGARAAVEHLLGAGHRRIAFLGDRPSVFTAVERRRGYREALALAGIAEDP